MRNAWINRTALSGAAEFDRWLASVKADSWDEFAVAARACDFISRSQKETLWEMNHYRGDQA
jgi:hypothetical protein